MPSRLTRPTLTAPSYGSYLHFLQSVTTLPLTLVQSALVAFSSHWPLIQHLTGFALAAIASGAAAMKAIRVVSTKNFFILCLLDMKGCLPWLCAVPGEESAHPILDFSKLASLLLQSATIFSAAVKCAVRQTNAKNALSWIWRVLKFSSESREQHFVTSAKAGVQKSRAEHGESRAWIPASAGMTRPTP